ncbi:MAG: hypothetical protein K9K37_10275 [Desulfocapsa sp.]|nr:hypothetical protein [Desulfocapsa sp.]
MWWNHGGCEPMHGWWYMPSFALLYLLVLIYIVARFFIQDKNRQDSFLGQHPENDHERDDDQLNSIKTLPHQVKELRQGQQNKT